MAKAGHKSQDLTPTEAQILTPGKSQILTPPSVGPTLEAEASSSTSTTLIKPVGADWTVRWHLAQFYNDLLGNPFQALLDLIPHGNLSMMRDVSAWGMAEQMLFFRLVASIF